MATSTFDKVFVVDDPAARERLERILSSDKPGVPGKLPLYTHADADRSEAALLACFSSRCEN